MILIGNLEVLPWETWEDYKFWGLWLSRGFCGMVYLIMQKLRFLCFASLLAMVFALLLIGDSPTLATEDPPPSSSASITITMTTPPLPD